MFCCEKKFLFEKQGVRNKHCVKIYFDRRSFVFIDLSVRLPGARRALRRGGRDFRGNSTFGLRLRDVVVTCEDVDATVEAMDTVDDASERSESQLKSRFRGDGFFVKAIASPFSESATVSTLEARSLFVVALGGT